jgi:hypothetical protein
MNKNLLALIKKSTSSVELGDLDYEHHVFNEEKFACLVVKACITELEAHERCDPYTGELIQCKKNDTIQELILALDELFSL